MQELREDLLYDIHWLLAGACWCRKRHEAGEAGIMLAAPPWARQEAEVTG